MYNTWICIIIAGLLIQDAEIGWGNEPCIKFREELKARSSEQLVDSLSSTNPTQRLLAAYSLRNYASDENIWIIPKLVDSLVDTIYIPRDDPLYRCILGWRHDGSSVSEEAAVSLAEWGASAIPALKKAYYTYRYKKRQTGKDALNGLSRIESRESFQIIADAANDPKHYYYTRYYALMLLGRLRYNESYEILISYLLSDNRILQEGAIEGLGYLGSTLAIGSLIEVGRTDVDLGHAAARALRRIDPSLGLGRFDEWEAWWSEKEDSARTIR